VKKTVWLAVAFSAAVLGYLVISSFQRRPFHCRVCITFDGRRDCRTASAETKQEALNAAITNACGVLSSGVVESNKCQTTAPDSIEWLK
jgi:hypothetical protein